MPLIPILMPQLGESIAEATVRHIGIKKDDRVTADQEIMEVETQKATMSVTIPCSGVVVDLHAKVDESYPVGATLGFLEITEEEAQRAGLSLDDQATQLPPSPATATSEAVPDDTHNLHFRYDASADFASTSTQTVEPLVRGLPVPVSATGATYISPRMRARMAELGLNAADLSAVAGSGEAGRVTVEDFEKFVSQLDSHHLTKASPMRIAVADSMRRSWSRPLATVGRPVTLDALLAHRKAADPKPGPALYAIRALALALAENTAVAGRLIGGRIVHPQSIDIGFAVEVDDGVLVPVIREVEKKTLSELVTLYNSLVELGRQRKLPRDAQGSGIATVTNFGTFGIVWATPIPLPEQNLVLGLGAGRKMPHWDEATQTFIPRMEAQLTLSFDHRVLDGGGAGRLLARVAQMLEAPSTI
jgi:pyruvate/2-oxoglutarate dehydrogenase complex dihydrolipoamide acyltransferase (E2) component